MPDLPENDDEFFRPVWETEDDEAPPGRPAARRPSVEPDYRHPLLMPLARAQDALARLETRAELASSPVMDGLRARMSYREAAGWLAHTHVWIYPHDLALRDRGMTGSYGPAFRAGHLAAEIPSTVAQEWDLDSAPSDIIVDQALRLARLWRRLAEMRTWRPLADTTTVQETLQSLGCRGAMAAAEIADWMATVEEQQGPLLVRAGRAARDWMNRPGVEPRNPDGMFLAACIWREKNGRRPIALPVWSAPGTLHHRLDLHVGLQWMGAFLECVAAAARNGLGELQRLQQAEEKARQLGRTSRSRLPEAIGAVLGAPIVSARDLAKTLAITPQAALGLLRQMAEAGLIREVTGRASWRAFALA